MPRVAAALGFSGSLSITRNRYSSGHCMKSLARDGESDAGGRGPGAPPPPGPAGGLAEAEGLGELDGLVVMVPNPTARH
ncbi:hypothetical protein GCM10010274_50180 [Streptomyces lavendofoliae]|uniref:Uncharacterized protein n=1 Tax=Streptomyces lavendofoliae TaxID=67314 RepID=A0A918M702_9ACTN|nr:hypothetical protein GCM10010274_50180 [Streptomyces lavendofoliae]